MVAPEMVKPEGQSSDAHRRLTDSQKFNWLRLIRSQNVGPTTFRELINHFGGSTEALEALPELSRRGGSLRSARICTMENAEREILAAIKLGATLVALGEPEYPYWLSMTASPPPLIYLKGDVSLVERPMVAIVGARNGSAIGQKFTRMIASDLGGAGFVIVSGLARGIDTSAHVASLERGTIAVLAGGIDSIYPPENGDLHQAIGEKGILLSEMPPGYRPRGQDFPRRNRIISGVSVGVIVVEAAKRSGSLITARIAGEQGREVFAVPGNPLDPRAAGTNMLLSDGAGIVTCAEDVITTLEPILGRSHERPELSGPAFDAKPDEPIRMDIEQPERERVIEALGLSPVDIDEVIRSTRLSARHVHIILLELDLAGRLERHGSQLVSLRNPGEF